MVHAGNFAGVIWQVIRMTNAKLLEGIVIKTVGGVFTVETDVAKFTCFAPKKLRYNDLDLLVGDKVRFSDLHRGKGSIVEILPRKNRLTRPEVANVDACLFVLASVPQPDFYLADKVLINCFQQKIEPIIVVNKIDLGLQTAQQVQQNYAEICDVVCVSATDDSLSQKLRPYIENRVVCFAGQSAVGKTSILNALLPNLGGKTGAVSQKSGRGTHTTRHTSLHKVMNGYVMDTCGFSLCTLENVRSDELRLYCDDFVKLSVACKFTSCTHTVEPDCAVKKAVEEGTLCRERYERYVEEHKELVEMEKNKY